jgi:hypothetical protein
MSRSEHAFGEVIADKAGAARDQQSHEVIRSGDFVGPSCAGGTR